MHMFCCYVCFVWIIASHSEGLILKDEIDCYHANIFSLFWLELKSYYISGVTRLVLSTVCWCLCKLSGISLYPLCGVTLGSFNCVHSLFFWGGISHTYPSFALVFHIWRFCSCYFFYGEIKSSAIWIWMWTCLKYFPYHVSVDWKEIFN